MATQYISAKEKSRGKSKGEGRRRSHLAKAAIYARVSTEQQAEDEIPILGQVEECQRYAESKGWQVVQVFKDEGYSGRSDERPALQEMISQVKETPLPFDIVLTWRGNRFFRSVEYRLAYTRILRRHDVRFVTLQEPELEGASARFVETIMAAADELYAMQIAEDTLRGLKQLARQGYSTGGRPPTGYRNVRKAAGLKPNGEPIMRTAWEPDLGIAPMVKKAFEMVAAGATSLEVCQQTRVVSNKSSLSTLLRNRAYLGERIYNRTRRTDKKTVRRRNPEEQVVRTLNSHEPIVSEELFNRVQAVVDKRRPRAGMQKPASRKYLLSGLLWCKKHSVRFSGQSSGTGGRAYYVCGARLKHGRKAIDCASIKKEALEDFILDTLKKQIFTYGRVKQGLKKLMSEDKKNRIEDREEEKALRKQIAQFDLELKRLHEAIKKGIPPDTLAEPLADTGNKKRELERLLHEITETKSPLSKLVLDDDAVSGIVNETHRLLKESQPVELKPLIQSIIDRIELDGHSATIWYSISPEPNSAEYVRPRGVASSRHCLSFRGILKSKMMANSAYHPLPSKELEAGKRK